MGRRTAQWVERNKTFAEYTKACDRLITEIENIEVLVDELGSDPLNILDILRPVPGDGPEVAHEPEVESPPESDTKEWVREKLETIEAPSWWEQQQRAEAEASVALDKEGPIQTQVVPKEEPPEVPVEQETWQAQKARERMDKKNKEIVKWIYTQLVNGPVPTHEIKKRAKKAGITEYGLLKARRTVDDIHITTVGYQGTRYWHLAQDVDKLPEAINFRPSEVVNAQITPNEQKILDLLQEGDRTTAELIGRTGWSPQKVKINTQKLSVRKLIKNDRATLKWSRYDN